MSTFELHPRLRNDCHSLGRLDLCRVLLMNDRTYPWLILVPQRVRVTEIFQLAETDQRLLIGESSKVAQAMVSIFRPDKLNIAAIGNLVPPLHVHHVARFVTDPAWPGTVWGRVPGEGYSPTEVDAVREAIGAEIPELRGAS
jgi:diadenosine tetraphosphate (Ap4A) HIT family hydrolase